MKLFNELLSLSEDTKGTTLVGITIIDQYADSVIITNKTKDEVWDGDFDCTHNPKLKSLEGAPKKVTGHFDCSRNPKLKSLKGSPVEVTGYFRCSDNPELTSLEGAPKEVSDNFHCSRNHKLTSLKGIHKQVTKIDGMIYAFMCPIKSHVLGLLLIKGLTGVELDNQEVEDILNKYLPNTRGNKALIECQSELLDANLEDYAEL